MPNSTTPLITGGSLHDSQTIKLPTSEQEIFPYEAYQHPDLTTELPKEDVEKMEKSVKTKKAEQEIHLKDNAFILLCCCLAAFALFYVVDTIVINLGGQTSSVLSSALDMAKTIITFLIGYLFAAEEPKN